MGISNDGIPNEPPSNIIKWYSRAIEFGNRWLTLGGILFRNGERVFMKIETMMLLMIVICAGLLLWIHLLPFWVGFVISVLLAQRILEYIVVYSRNFIFNRGRVFTHFPDKQTQGEWLITIFFLNIIQMMVIFATWFRFISFHFPDSFSKPLGVFDSLYFTIVTFFTIGYGDIVPVAGISKTLILLETVIGFYTIVIVINGLISLHFNGGGRGNGR